MDFQMTRVRSATGREQKRISQSRIFLRLQDVIVCDPASHQACFLHLTVLCLWTNELRPMAGTAVPQAADDGDCDERSEAVGRGDHHRGSRADGERRCAYHECGKVGGEWPEQ